MLSRRGDVGRHVVLEAESVQLASGRAGGASLPADYGQWESGQMLIDSGSKAI